MGTWTDIVTSSAGSTTTKVRINGNTSFVVPAIASGLLEVTPYQAATGAYTAAQSAMTRFYVESNSLSGIGPKEFVFGSTHGGLGTFAGVQVPVLRCWPLNVPTQKANVNVDFYTEAQVTNTVEFRTGAEVLLTDGAMAGPQQYYDAPDNESATGTAAAANAGNTLTINGAKRINLVYGQFGVGTVTASESYVGYFSIRSADMYPNEEQWALQPVGVGLGTAVEVLAPDFHSKKVDLRVNPTTTLSTEYFNEEAVTVAHNFIAGVGFQRQ
jgi:hypothetical protein